MDAAPTPASSPATCSSAGPQADPDVSELLLRAAAEAARRGVPRAAAAYLERALEERAPGDDRGAHARPARHGRLRRRPARLARGACARRCARSRDREGRIDVLTRLAALNLVDAGDAGLAQLFEQELAGETDPRRPPGGRGRLARRADDLPRAPRRARAARRRDRPLRDRRPAARARSCSPTARGSAPSSARPTRRRWARARAAARSTAACCSRRRTGARPTRSAPARWSMTDHPRGGARRSPRCARRR